MLTTVFVWQCQTLHRICSWALTMLRTGRYCVPGTILIKHMDSLGSILWVRSLQYFIEFINTYLYLTSSCVCRWSTVKRTVQSGIPSVAPSRMQKWRTCSPARSTDSGWDTLKPAWSCFMYTSVMIALPNLYLSVICQVAAVTSRGMGNWTETKSIIPQKGKKTI